MSSNHLLNINRLQNDFYIMRHGRSLANEEGIILSNSQEGVSGYGLSHTGKEQARMSIRQCTMLNRETLIISSDFKRARETAEIVCEEIETPSAVLFDARLRERFFGDYDKGNDNAYKLVWKEDQQDADYCGHNVESPNRVMARVTELVTELDALHRHRNILLVSHGDSLQILQTAFEKKSASRHRELLSLQTAEIRALSLQFPQ